MGIAGEPLMSATWDGLAWIYDENLDHNVSAIADARATQPQTAERHATEITCPLK